MGGQLPEREQKRGEAAGTAADSETIARLFTEHNRALVGFLRLRVGSEQEARDIAQEAYVRLLQLNQPDAVSFLRSYLFKIANNLATDRLRGDAVRRTAHADPFFSTAETTVCPEREVSARQRLGLIDAALRELPEQLRAAFLLRRLDGLSSKDIGVRLGVSERTARNYIIKAMVHCRSKLFDHEPDFSGGRE